MPSGNSSLIEETLKPLFKKKEELEGELADIQAQAEVKKDEIKTIDKLLRAGGLLEAKAGRPRTTRGPNASVSQEFAVRVYEAIKTLGLKEFTATDISENMGGDRTLIRHALFKLRDERLIRLASERRRDGKTSGPKAAHFALIGEGKTNGS